MRAVFGIGGILATLGVIVWIMSFELTHDKAVIDAGNKATGQANQMAGRDENGTPAKQSATLEPQQSNGKTVSVLVTNVIADGPYAKVWGLQRNDAIVEIGQQDVKDMNLDMADAENEVMTAYQNNWPLTVYRSGQKMVLQPTSSPLTQLGIPGAAQSQQIPTH